MKYRTKEFVKVLVLCLAAGFVPIEPPIPRNRGPGQGNHQEPSAPLAWPRVRPGAPPRKCLKGLFSS